MLSNCLSAKGWLMFSDVTRQTTLKITNSDISKEYAKKNVIETILQLCKNNWSFNYYSVEIKNLSLADSFTQVRVPSK